MKKHAGDHSPDLEWMLLSQQVDDETLVSNLVREFGLEIHRLALSQLTYPEMAYSATCDVFLQAVLNAKHYASQRSIQAWLESITWKIIIEQQKHLAEQELLNLRLISALNRYTNRGLNTSPVLDRLIKDVLKQLQNRRSTRLSRSRVQEILLVGIAILVFLGLLQLGENISSLVDNRRQAQIDVPLNQRSAGVIQDQEGDNRPVYYSSKYPGGIPAQPPLTINSSHEDIWRRILLSRYTWNSLWVDLSVILHGPADYIGPPLVERHQVWLTQGKEGIHISGSLSGQSPRLEKITPADTGPGNLQLLYGIEDFSRLGSQVPWFYLSSEAITSVPYMANFFFLAAYDFPPHRLSFRAIEQVLWAGRQVVIVNAVDKQGVLRATLWLDSQTGLALKEQYFSGNSHEHTRLETIVERVEFDRHFSRGLLSRLNSTEQGLAFASGYQGFPEDEQSIQGEFIWGALSSRSPQPAMPPPAEFNPSNSHLTFATSGGSLESNQEQHPVMLYADQYLLGDLYLDDPWHSICSRSTDGKRIVLSQWSQPPDELVSRVGWYELPDMTPNLVQIPQVTITRLAYSPDGAFIAAAGVNQMTGLSHLYLIDPHSGEFDFIPGFDDAWSIAWSPDGNQLASLNLPSFRLYTPWKIRIVIYDLVSETIHSATILDDYSWGYSSAQIPLPGWTANFPLTMHGLEPCAEPPPPAAADSS